jgi:cysteine dioxygenase
MIVLLVMGGEMERLSLSQFIAQLKALEPAQGELAAVAAYLAGHRPRIEDLELHVRFEPGRYSRQRVYRDDDFEVLLLCWEQGQSTPIHEHGGRHGWVTVVGGRLRLQEFLPETAPVEGVPMLLRAGAVDEAGPGETRVETVRPETVHRVGSPHGRALSLHIYARPLDSFLAYDESRQMFVRVQP